MSDATDLLTGPGQELLARLRGVTVTPEAGLRLGAELRASYPAGLVAAALTQQALRQSASEKFSRADEMYFTRAGLEQASAELVAAHSATRFAGFASVADLCCGIGGDLIALAAVAGHVLAADADADTLAFATGNVAVTHPAARLTAVCTDVRDLDLAGLDAVFIDPARRAGGRRLRTGDAEPPLDWCLSLADRVPRVAIKFAPGVARELVPAGWETEFVAVGRGLKEALLWSPGFATTSRRATVLPGSLLASDAGRGRAGAGGAQSPFPSMVSGDARAAPVREPGGYLLDPNPAVTRAGLVAELARDCAAWQIDPQIAFLSADEPVATPFARTLRVIASLPWHERRVAALLRELGIGIADVRRRGLAGDVQQIHRRLGLRGDRAATIVLTRRTDQPWCLVCEAVS